MNNFQTLKYSFLIFLFCTLDSGFQICAETYKEQLQNGLRLSYRHWNTKRQEFTGFTHQEFKLDEYQGQQVLLETQINIKSEGKEIRRRSLWYELDSGKPITYLEEDLEEDIHIMNSYQNRKVITSLRQGLKKVKFEVDLKDELSVSFELLLPFLRKNLDKIQNNNEFLFTLYIPALAIELENSALPRSMSLIKMRVRQARTITWESKLGNRRAVWLEIFPNSMMLRTLLPKKKSHFRFLLELESPNHILQFEEGENIYTLTFMESID